VQTVCESVQTVKGGAYLCVQVVFHLEWSCNRQGECAVSVRCRARQAEPDGLRESTIVLLLRCDVCRTWCMSIDMLVKKEEAKEQRTTTQKQLRDKGTFLVTTKDRNIYCATKYIRARKS
jgi:hypothetical protein